MNICIRIKRRLRKPVYVSIGSRRLTSKEEKNQTRGLDTPKIRKTRTIHLFVLTK